MSNIDPIAVKSAAQVATLLDRANKNRAVAATNCNERSSRSHSVFRLQLIGSNDITAEKCKGQFSGWHPVPSYSLDPRPSDLCILMEGLVRDHHVG